MKHITWLALLASTVSCADLPTLSANNCGNGVVDQGEDCDTFPRNGCRPPGDAHACRLDCSACPSGWGCDLAEGICRQPLGTFEATPSATFEATVARLEVADFDGDGRQDLLARSQADSTGRETLRVFYFDGKGPPAKSLTLGASAISAIAHNLDTTNPNPHHDLAFATYESGINVMLGQPNRTFAPIAFPRFPFPPGSSARFVRVNGMDIPAEVKFFRAIPVIFAEMEPGKFVIALATVQGEPPILGTLDRHSGNMEGEPVAANIVDGNGDASMACEEVLWVWKDSGTVSWLQPCLPGNLPWIDPMRRPKPLLTLPGGDVIKRTPVAVDINRDGHVDLLLKGKSNTYVSYGKGDGTFYARPDLTGTEQAAILDCTLLHPKTGKPMAIAGRSVFSCGAPLAGYAAPKHPDPTLDRTIVVFPSFALTIRRLDYTSPGRVVAEGIALAEPGGAAWTVARFDDFNANGYIDIAAASESGSDIDFFNGTPTELFNPGRIRTDSPVKILASGDYDGDLVNDLGYVEAGGGGPGIDAINVAYGRFAGPPEPGLRLGQFPNIIQASTAKAAGFDETLQLGVIYKGEENTDLIAILEGAGDRQLLSPFGLANVNPMTKELAQGFPFLIAPGDFDGDGKSDLVSFGYDADGDGFPEGTMRPWFVRGRGDGRFEPPEFGEAVTSFRISSFRRLVGAVRAADLDGDKRDELAALVVNPAGSVPMFTVLKKPTTGRAFEMSPPTAVPGAPTGVMFRLDLALADLDGDGKLDAVMGVHAVLKSAVIVAWGKGDGTFDVASATTIALPDARSKPNAFATTQLDLDPAKELLIAASDFTYSIQADGRTFHVAKILPGADAVTSGDIDGDGIPDVILAKSHRVAVYLGESR